MNARTAGGILALFFAATTVGSPAGAAQPDEWGAGGWYAFAPGPEFSAHPAFAIDLGWRLTHWISFRPGLRVGTPLFIRGPAIGSGQQTLATVTQATLMAPFVAQLQWKRLGAALAAGFKGFRLVAGAGYSRAVSRLVVRTVERTLPEPSWPVSLSGLHLSLSVRWRPEG